MKKWLPYFLALPVALWGAWFVPSGYICMMNVDCCTLYGIPFGFMPVSSNPMSGRGMWDSGAPLWNIMLWSVVLWLFCAATVRVKWSRYAIAYPLLLAMTLSLGVFTFFPRLIHELRPWLMLPFLLIPATIAGSALIRTFPRRDRNREE